MLAQFCRWPLRGLAMMVSGLLLLGPGFLHAQSMSGRPLVGLRTGDHPGYTRLVFDLPEGARAVVSQDGGHVVVRFAGGTFLPTQRAPQRNVTSVKGLGDGVAIELVPGASLRQSSFEQKLVLDVLDPGSEVHPSERKAKVAAIEKGSSPARTQPQVPAADRKDMPTSSTPTSSSPASGVPVPGMAPPPQIAHSPGVSSKAAATVPPPPAQARGPVVASVPTPASEGTARSVLEAAPAAAATTQSVPAVPQNAAQPPWPSLPPQPMAPKPAAAQVQRPQAVSAATQGDDNSGPAALLASARPAPAGAPGHALDIPFATTVGAAAFARGQETLVVFDDRKPVDLRSLRSDPVFGSASVQLLPGATVLHLRLPPQTELELEHRPAGWSVLAIGGTAQARPVAPIRIEQVGNHLSLPSSNVGAVISVPDPETGGLLLVGTQRTPGQGIPMRRRGPDFNLLPSYQGVVIEPLSDLVQLRATGKGFDLTSTADGGVLVSGTPDSTRQEAMEKSSHMSRIFDFPNQPNDGLLRRLQAAVASSASAPPQSKAEPRRKVAESMLALGLASEAQGVLGLAASGDARSSENAQQAGLAAVAALLTGHPDDAGGLDDPRLSNSDETEFWRAVRAAKRREGDPSAAQTFAGLVPLLMDYPQPLRDRLLPLVVETLALGGQPEAAERLTKHFSDNPDLDLARGLLKQARVSDDAQALAIFDRLSSSTDRLVRLRAAQRAAEMRLASGKAGAKETAATLAKLLLAWRGDEREYDLRLRVAQLQSDSAQPRASLKLLHETADLWPDRRVAIRELLTAVLTRALGPEQQATLSPFDLVTLAEENAAHMPTGDASLELAVQLADRLMVLDLPKRAAPLLERLAKAAPPGVAKAVFGGRLAGLRQQLGDPAGALEALNTSVADSLPASLLESRTMTFAEAVASQGDMVSADRALIALDTDAGDHLRAKLKESAKDWPGAMQAWKAVMARSVPAAGILSEAQAQIVVRVASAAAQGGDNQTLAALRQSHANRLPAGPSADLFMLLTGQPVSGPADLGVVSRDVALAKAVPSNLRLSAPPAKRASLP